MPPEAPWTKIVLPPNAWEYGLLVLYTAAILVLLARSWKDFRTLTLSRLFLFLGLLVASVLGAYLTYPLLIPGLFQLLPPPNLPVMPSLPVLSFLSLPVLIAATWLGAGPAMAVGMVGGLMRAGLTTNGVTDFFYFAVFGYLAGSLIRQDYRGTLSLLARQPILAAPVALILGGIFLPVSIIARTADAGLVALDYAMSLAGANLVVVLLEALITGVLIQAIYLLVPRWRPVSAAYRTPPHTRTLNRRMLFLFVPLIITMILVLLYAVTATTIRVATQEVIRQMARDARSTAEDIPYFIHTGQGLLQEFASDERLQQEDRQQLEERLSGDLRTIAFFDQLMLFDAQGNMLAMYPTAPHGDPQLTEQEQSLLELVLQSGATRISTAHRSTQDVPILSFLVPVEKVNGSGDNGALLGRTQLEINPVLNRALDSLQRTRGEGRGFIVDETGRIVAHSDPTMLFAEWHVDPDVPPLATMQRGYAYESPNPQNNTRELVYYLPAEGYDWAVVIRLPYQVVLEQARQVATPLLILQLLLGGGLVVVIPLVTGLLTRPLSQLAAAADRIAEGNLDRPVMVPGDDEVARVGQAFEGMRRRLKGRLDDLSLLLRVSQAVSATLELSKGMPYILEGALKATNARVARIVLLSNDGAPQMVIGRGQPREGLGTLDRALSTATRDQGSPLVIENLLRARTLGEPEVAAGATRAVIALPIRTKGQVAAVMWIGYNHVRRFEDSEIDLLSTLASQTAVLVENARLFQAAEGGRRRLAAILSSTTDAILVTDRDDHILLVNPAAEQAFGITASLVVGQTINEVRLDPALKALLREPLPDSDALTEEVPLPDGRTLYANVSAILNAEGARIGRVALLRDITHFKELDEMKSEFVATVSHDLRAPLTFMRGYTTMLPMVDELSPKQTEYVDKILQGIGQMSNLIDDLLNLGRIEAGVGLERQECHLGAILVEAVDSMRTRAAAKNLKIELEPAAGGVVTLGDVALLRQAIANLVDNAIKYTPEGGRVKVALRTSENQAIICVTDTGVGIAPDDQVRLFEKFYRIKRRDTAHIQGTGLGLAIVKSIVERHDGKVWVESELNAGSSFYIGLPLSEGNGTGPAKAERET